MHQPFPIVNWLYGNAALVVWCFWVFNKNPDGAVVVYVISFAIVNTAIIMRWWLWPPPLKVQPQSTAFPRRKLLLGNASAVVFMGLYYLEGVSRLGIILAAIVLFGGGNLAFVVDWKWRKSRLPQSDPPPPLAD